MNKSNKDDIESYNKWVKEKDDREKQRAEMIEKELKDILFNSPFYSRYNPGLIKRPNILKKRKES